jgi:protein-S-isoprenylcysteine O-methyltransferase Ste14
MLRSDLRVNLTRIRVPAGFLLAALYFYVAHPTLKSLVAGCAVALVGLVVRAWATGHIIKNDALAMSGPYAYTRNPLYFGSFLIGVGFSLAGGNPAVLVVFLIGFGTLYGSVMQQEMDFLSQKFLADYDRYQGAVPLFFPQLRPARLSATRFSFARYRNHREYQALLGFIVAIVVLFVKAVHS